jgi:ATP-binding cassette subfamily B protein
VLDKGEIKETGTHEELLALGGFYSKLHGMQLEKKKVAAV